jgi:cytohesin
MKTYNNYNIFDIKKHFNILESLIRAGDSSKLTIHLNNNKMLDINRISSINTTLLGLCASLFSDDVKTLKVLLDHGANPNIKHNSVPPLSIAIISHNLNIMKILLEYGADINAKSGNNNKTPLQYSVNWLKLSDESLFLIENGADMSIRDENGDDFINYLLNKEVKKVKKLYPKEYKQYLINKALLDYNI